MLLKTLFLLSHLFCNVHSELIWLIEFQNKMNIVIIGFFTFWIYLRLMKCRLRHIDLLDTDLDYLLGHG